MINDSISPIGGVFIEMNLQRVGEGVEISPRNPLVLNADIDLYLVFIGKLPRVDCVIDKFIGPLVQPIRR